MIVSFERIELNVFTPVEARAMTNSQVEPVMIDQKLTVDDEAVVKSFESSSENLKISDKFSHRSCS